MRFAERVEIALQLPGQGGGGASVKAWARAGLQTSAMS